MRKKGLVTVLCLVVILTIFYLVARPTDPVKKPEHLVIPTTSLEKDICKRVATQFGDCKRILMYDAESHLVFVENSTAIYPVLTNKEFTQFKKFIFPMMDFQEFREERTERGPIDWRAKSNIQEDLSVIYGFAEDAAKTIVINSEGNIQPNRFFVRDNLWVWYVTISKAKVKLPVKVTVYNANGQIIYGGNQKD
ncbi:hypothetical protein [Neobacillus drentensis]|uniref:hypothetical protein n=1 Tax=Neobacillus drentensis TaxID=220684 RepID=UPI003000CF12